MPFLKRFIHDAFNHNEGADARFWPELEDLFTCIDLAANSGHYLGPQYEPARLRTVRRALIARIIKMLRQHSKPKHRKEDAWQQLQGFFRRVDVRNTAFISMNWDTVIEQILLVTQGISAVDYGCNARAAEFKNSQVCLRDHLGSQEVQVLKIHGSVNWMYCDNCRELLWFPPEQSSKIATKIATLLFVESDWDLVRQRTGSDYRGRTIKVRCPSCGARALGTRLATFSYRKALEFPMFHETWLAAERLLREASAWIFIGYSLPGADYEFKYLLKRTQLARCKVPKLILITGGKPGQAEQTYHNYQRFFGRHLKKSGVNQSCFMSGLDPHAIAYLREIGALKDN